MMVEQASLGALDLVIPTEPAIAKYVNKFNLVGAPFAFKDYAATDRFFAGGFLKWANPDLEKAGSKYLARWEYGFRTYTCSLVYAVRWAIGTASPKALKALGAEKK